MAWLPLGVEHGECEHVADRKFKVGVSDLGFVEFDTLELCQMHATQIDDTLGRRGTWVGKEHPHVVVPLEFEFLTAQVFKRERKLRGEEKVVTLPLVFAIDPKVPALSYWSCTANHLCIARCPVLPAHPIEREV